MDLSMETKIRIVQDLVDRGYTLRAACLAVAIRHSSGSPARLFSHANLIAAHIQFPLVNFVV